MPAMGTIGISLAAAAAFALSSSLKHGSAGQMPDAGGLEARRLRRFVVSTLAHPLWLGGIVADVAGLTLQVIALHLGALSLVQPLLISSLIFALLLRQVPQRRFDRAALLWSVVLAGGLGGFVLLSGAAAHAGPASTADRGPAAVTAAVGVALVAVCIALGRRQGRAGQRATLFGVAVGTVYAATAAMLKAVSDVATHGVVSLLASWQLYVLVLLGAFGLLLNQLAFQAGPLTASLPAIATVDPLLSIAIGVTVYDENLHHGSGTIVALAAVLLVMGIAVIQLSRIEAVEEARAGMPEHSTATPQ